MQIQRFFKPQEDDYFLFGPRGTGKSTLLRSLYPDAVWIDLLDPETSRVYSAKPERIFEAVDGNPDRKTLIVDEVQRIPELLPAIHKIMEERKDWRFCPTGSSARKLRRAGVDLLAGWALLHTIHPFMAGELSVDFSLERALRTGVVPLIDRAENPAETLRSYGALYMKEVKAEGLVRNVGDSSRFLETLHFRCGGFRSLRPSGLLDRATEMEGAALEGLYQHLLAWCSCRGDRESLHFRRTQSQVEVDFIVYGPGCFWAFEDKSGWPWPLFE